MESVEHFRLQKSLIMKSVLLLVLSSVLAVNISAQTQIDAARAAVRSDAASADRQTTSMFMAGLRRGAPKSAAQKAKLDAFRKNVLSTIKEQEITVDKIVDGDMFESVVSGRRLLLRLVGVDAPEEGQENWKEAKEQLETLIAGKKVTVRFSSFYPRHVNGYFIVRAVSDNKDVGSQILSSGWAWYDSTYSVFFTEKEDEANEQAIKNARHAKLGIWKNGKPEEPWEYFEDAQKERAKTTKIKN